MDSDSSGALFRTRAVSRSDSTICKFRPTWRSICLQHDPQLGVLADKTGGLLATPARLYPRATPPGRTLGACHSAVSPPVVRRGRPSMVTATCRIFRRSQRPKDDAVGKWRSLYRRLSGPLRFPRYHVHPKRRQSLLARVPGLCRCLLVVRCERPSGQKYCCVCNISAVGVSRTAGFCPMTARPRDFALSGTEQAGSWDIIYSAYGAVVLGTAYRSY